MVYVDRVGGTVGPAELGRAVERDRECWSVCVHTCGYLHVSVHALVCAQCAVSFMGRSVSAASLWQNKTCEISYTGAKSTNK